MANDLSKIIEQSKAFWSKLSKTRQIAVGVGAAAGLFALFMVVGQRPVEPYSTLFSGMREEDAGRVLEQLKAQNVAYKIESGGTAVSVPSSRVHELRIALAASGLPKGGGVGFELFDKQNFGATSFVEQMNYRRALQGELQRTISSLDSVERARVHIAMRERSLFRDEDEPPSASVVLALHPGRQLSSGQIRGIVHLVASSVEGLRPDNVTLVDESGATLWSGEAGHQAVEVGHELERRLGRRVSELVERVVGAGRASVAITADLDTTRSERTEETYDKDKSVLRSEQRSEEMMGTPAATGSTAAQNTGGVAGARGNLPGAPAPVLSVGQDGRTKIADTKNWEVTKTVVRSTAPSARIKRLHVAVLVDEIADPQKPGATIPRTKEQMAELAALVREAAGIDADRGDKLEVRCVAFGDHKVETPMLAGMPIGNWKNDPRMKWVLIGAGAFVGLLVVTIGLLLVRRRGKKPIEATILPALPAKLGSVEAALGGTTIGATTPSPELPAPSPRDRAQDAVRRDATRAARVISSWLAEAANNNTSAPNGAKRTKEAS